MLLGRACLQSGLGSFMVLVSRALQHLKSARCQVEVRDAFLWFRIRESGGRPGREPA